MNNQEFSQLERSIGRLEGKFEQFSMNVLGRLDRMSEKFGELSQDMTELKQFKDETAGAQKQIQRTASIIGAMAGGFVSTFIWIVSKIMGRN